ncbi:MAG: tryptophan-rich sensory protein [Cyanobacteriota bacterium]|nr:tryptophan-rich sensory protein [Cyanobacteriota bacterium]
MLPFWLVIPGVALAIAFVFNRLFPDTYKSAQHYDWFRRLRRPRWLTFEGAIPFIWIFIFICGIASACLVWQVDPSRPIIRGLMAGYVGVEVAILAYMPLLCGLRSLRVGVIAGASGWLWGSLLTLWVWPLSAWAGVLLLPYVLWSPIGTYVTWEMLQLNPTEA